MSLLAPPCWPPDPKIGLMAEGAAALVLASAEGVRSLGRAPVARLMAYAHVAMCIGGGQVIAAIFERV